MKPIKQTEIVARFKYEDLTLTMFWDGATRGNKVRIDYEFKKGETVLMQGDDFCTPEYPDSIKAVVQLLGFMVIAPGETYKEYFINHSLPMLEWLNSTQRDEVNTYVNDYEMGEDGCRITDECGVEFAKDFFASAVEIMPA